MGSGNRNPNEDNFRSINIPTSCNKGGLPRTMPQST
jgi:hypothetical protein